jgi:hypothetical protein
MSARTGIFNYLTGRALCKAPRPADEAEGLLAAHRAEVLHETPLFLAEYEGAETEVHLTLEDARAMCDDIAKTVRGRNCWDWSRNEDGVYVQFWTHADDDRPLHLTGGTVTEVRAQRPADEEKATPTGEATPDFFQPGRTYAYEASGFTAPELVTVFRVASTTTHPATGAAYAFGWIRKGETTTWTPYAEPADDWPHAWTEITEGGDAR